MANSYGVFQDVVPAPGNLQVPGSFTQTAITDGLTAKASGGQQTTGATVIAAPTAMVRVSTVASAADSITLPTGLASGVGSEVVVFNAAAANALAVFPATGDIINNLSANASFSVAAGKGCSFFCTSITSAGVARWNTMLGA